MSWIPDDATCPDCKSPNLEDEGADEAMCRDCRGYFDREEVLAHMRRPPHDPR